MVYIESTVYLAQVT